MTNNQLLRWLVETPSRDIHHYRNCWWKFKKSYFKLVVTKQTRHGRSCDIEIWWPSVENVALGVRHISMSHSLPSCIICILLTLPAYYVVQGLCNGRLSVCLFFPSIAATCRFISAASARAQQWAGSVHAMIRAEGSTQTFLYFYCYAYSCLLSIDYCCGCCWCILSWLNACSLIERQLFSVPNQ